MKILISEHRRAEENLTLEQQLLAGTEQVVLLYVNERAVVVGRNQTIEAEVDSHYCNAHGIEVVRRRSGGGTVFHDGGNLNYAIICDAGPNPLDRDYTEPIVWALRRLGVEASGSACMVSRGRVLFHGTLLFDADLTALEAALQGDESRRGKGVRSVRSRVRNLKPMLHDVPDMEHFTERMREAITEFYAQE